jgi:hypothetical protein
VAEFDFAGNAGTLLGTHAAVGRPEVESLDAVSMFEVSLELGGSDHALGTVAEDSTGHHCSCEGCSCSHDVRHDDSLYRAKRWKAGLGWVRHLMNPKDKA